jgi:hypothetical protein
MLLLLVIPDQDLKNRIVVHLWNFVDFDTVVKRQYFNSFSEATSDEHKRGIFRVMDHEFVDIFFIFWFVLNIKIMLVDHLLGDDVPNKHRLIWAFVQKTIQEILIYR